MTPEEKQTIENDYCPCCASDYIEKEVLSENGVVTAYCHCKYCGSTFNYEYVPKGIKVTSNKAGTMYMNIDKEVITFALETLCKQTKIGDEMIITDRVKFMCDELIAYLHDTDSEMLENSFKTSIYFKQS